MTHANLLSPERKDQGYIIVLPGIEGRSFFNASIVRGLLDAGVPYAIERYDWTRGVIAFVYNLCSRRLHSKQAQVIADKVTQYQDEYPDRPVYLIGHSGGGAMALFATANLPEQRTVTGLILLANAMSHGYELDDVLKQVEQKVWNVTSIADLFFLGLETTTLGTMDRKWTFSAGLTGFTSPLAAKEKLVEMPYRAKYFFKRNFAGHFGCTARSFVKTYLAPLLSPTGE